MYVIRVLFITLVVFLVGCTALTSEIEDGGVVYFLPKSILNISVTEFAHKNGQVWYQLGSFHEKYEKNKLDAKRISRIESELVPDTQHRYVLTYQPSRLSDDRLCISRDANGLLRDVEFAADDRTPQIAFNVARLLKGSLTEQKTSGFKPESSPPLQLRTYSSRIDPFSWQDIEAFNGQLSRIFGRNLRLDFSGMQEQLKKRMAYIPQGCSFKDGNCSPDVWRPKCSPENICYRTKVNVPIYLSENGKTVDVDYAEVVNLVDMGAINVKRAFLVHTITKLRFDQGTLLGATIRKPSEVEEATLLPLHVLNAALITPSGLWANAFTGTNNENEKLLEAINNTSQKIAALNKSAQDLQGSLLIDTSPVQQAETFEPNCQGKRGTSVFNLITNSALDPKLLN